MRVQRWTAVLVASVALAGAAVGCSEDEEPAPRAATTTTSTPDPAAGPPGTALPGGLEVPEGAHLLGAAVSIPSLYELDGRPVREPDRHRAVLAVTDDPLAAFEALVAQARADGHDVPGGAGSCLWTVDPTADGDIPPDRPVAGLPLAEEVEATGVHCEASTTTAERTLLLRLDLGHDRPALLEVEAGVDPDAPDGRFGAAEQVTPLDPDDPVPAAAARALPEPPAAPEDDEPGDPVLGTAWCRSAPDAGDLLVPEGARVLARPASRSGVGDVALLAVDDADAALTALYEQAAGEDGAEGGGGFFGEPPGTVELEDGTVVEQVTFGANAGGDRCDLVASPDGSTVLLVVGRG